MTSGSHTMGICPNCREEGDVGEACPEKGCTKRGYHRIPAAMLGEQDRLEPEIGLLLDRRYLLVRMLGEGGFGRVFVALQMPLRRQVAVKVLKKDRDAETHDSRMRLFRQEAEAMSRLAHPNIVQIQDFGFFDGAAYLVLEFLDGGRTLKDELKLRSREHRDLTIEEVEAILSGILHGLEEAHSHRIIHRDIKPENVMLQVKPGHPYLPRLLDFGLAKFVDAETQSSAILGTPAYMAPEQLTKKDPGPWTDLYALGVMAYELMTGRRPFTGEVGEILADKRDPTFDVLEPIADLQVPEPIATFLQRAIHHDPQARFRSAPEFRTAMQDAFRAARGSDRDALRSIDLTEIARGTASSDMRDRARSARVPAAPVAPPPAPPTVALPATRSVPIDDATSAPRSPRARASPPPKRPGALWLVAGVILIGGAVAAAVGLSGGDPEATTEELAGVPATTVATVIVNTLDHADTHVVVEDTHVAATPSVEDAVTQAVAAEVIEDTIGLAVTAVAAEDVVVVDTLAEEAAKLAEVAAKADALVVAAEAALKKKAWNEAITKGNEALALVSDHASAKDVVARARRAKAAAAAAAAKSDEGGIGGSVGGGGGNGPTPVVVEPRKTLSTNDIRKATSGKFGRCALMNTGEPTTVRVRFVILGTGSVQTVQITEAGSASAELRNCVTTTIKGLRFPTFSDGMMTVNLPLML